MEHKIMRFVGVVFWKMKEKKRESSRNHYRKRNRHFSQVDLFDF